MFFYPKYFGGQNFFGPNIFFWIQHFFGPNIFFRSNIVFRPNIFLDTQFFFGAKSFLEPKFFLDPQFFWTQNQPGNDLWRDKTELLNLRLSKRPSAKVLLKLEFDTKDQVLFYPIFWCSSTLHNEKILENTNTNDKIPKI